MEKKEIIIAKILSKFYYNIATLIHAEVANLKSSKIVVYSLGTVW